MKNKIIKHTVKDSVFTDLFGMPEYLIQLYQTLHPEDHKTTIDDISNVTIRNILVNDLYNDLGFMVENRLVILVECQSTWSENIVIRGLQYLVETYNRYFEENCCDLYVSTKVFVPIPELYVIYTGKSLKTPEFISLKDSFFGGKNVCIDAKIRVIKYTGNADVINQYIGFTRVLDDCIKKYGRTRESLKEAIDICRDKDILADYLQKRREEVMDIYTNLFDQEVVFDRHVKSECKLAEKRALKTAAEKIAKNLMDDNPNLSYEDALAKAEAMIK